MTFRVSVTGPRGSGKTTASIEIQRALKEAGFEGFTIEDVHGDNTQKGLPVAGYKTQSQEAINAVNVNKVSEEQVLRIIDTLRNGQTQDGHSIHVDQRWLSVAQTHLELAFMALNRAIFQPGRIEGDLG